MYLDVLPTLNNMEKDELKQLRERVQKALDTFKVRKRRRAYEAVKTQAAGLGYKLGDFKTAKAKRLERLRRMAKFFNPKNPAQTWTGHGRPPEWFLQAIRDGYEDEDMLVRREGGALTGG